MDELEKEKDELLNLKDINGINLSFLKTTLNHNYLVVFAMHC